MLEMALNGEKYRIELNFHFRRTHWFGLLPPPPGPPSISEKPMSSSCSVSSELHRLFALCLAFFSFFRRCPKMLEFER